MLTRFHSPVRALLLAAILALAAQTADARSSAPDPPQTTARSTARSKSDAVPTDRDGISVDGIVIIAGIVGVVILLAWVCSRIGDSR